MPNDNVLQRIMDHKRGEIAAAQQKHPRDVLEAELAGAPLTRSFVAAIRRASGLALIAEVKKASPSAGVIKADFDPVAIAESYAEAGAHCLSVLTDVHFFHGHLDFLRAVRAAVSLPILRKDFVLDEYQLLEARVAGADAVLLIAECLPGDELPRLYHAATRYGLDCLIEIYDPKNLPRVLELDPPLVGVNNRDLRSFHVSLDQTLRIAPLIPAGTMLVSESGIRTGEETRRLAAGGVKAILVGETLMRANNMKLAVAELLA